MRRAEDRRERGGVFFLLPGLEPACGSSVSDKNRGLLRPLGADEGRCKSVEIGRGEGAELVELVKDNFCFYWVASGRASVREGCNLRGKNCLGDARGKLTCVRLLNAFFVLKIAWESGARGTIFARRMFACF